MFRLLSSSISWSALLLLVLSSACGGGKDDEEPSLNWECYEYASFGECECTGLEPGDILVVASDSAVEVDECTGYPVCFSYYDESFEEYRCDCGDESFMPFGDEEDLSDLTMEESCPPK